MKYGKTFKLIEAHNYESLQTMEIWEKMKKAVLAILGVVVLCILSLAMILGTVSAAKAGYGFTISTGADITAWEGAVSPATEWDDSYKDRLYDGWTMTASFFRCKWGMTPAICENWLIEFLGDTTNDAGDWWEISVDTLVDGAATPQADDFKVNWTAAAGVKVYVGTGTTWAASAAVVGTDVVGGTSIAASPASATPHRIVEIYLDKGTAGGVLAMGLNNNARLAIYDAGTGTTVMWPPYSSANDPSTYGAGTTDLSMTAIPEGLTIGVMVLLSSVAVVVSTRYFRKRS
jgi:hypothetical protein